jgi:Ca2+-binding EF-hand superfamily protein
MALAASCALAGAAAASAANDNPATKSAAIGGSERFDQLDRNRDGYISRDEAKDAEELNTRFSELDVNNDGKLSRDEYGSLKTSASGATTANTGSNTRSRPASGSNTK